MIQEIKDLYGTILLIDDDVFSNKQKTKNLLAKIEKLKKEPFAKIFLKFSEKNLKNVLDKNLSIKDFQVVDNSFMVRL